PERRRPRRHAEHGVGLGVEQLGDHLRRQFAHLVVILPDDHFHEILALCSLFVFETAAMTLIRSLRTICCDNAAAAATCSDVTATTAGRQVRTVVNGERATVLPAARNASLIGLVDIYQDCRE